MIRSRDRRTPRLRHAGRVRGLDHRLGPDPRVSLRRSTPWAVRLVGVRGSFLKDVGTPIPGPVHLAPYTHFGAARCRANVWRLFTRAWSSTGAVLNVPAMIIVALITILLITASRVGGFNNLIVIIKLTVVLSVHRLGIAYFQPGELGAVRAAAAARAKVRVGRHPSGGRG